MKHPSDLMDRYSTGLLPTSSLIAIDEHLVACEPCRGDLAPPPGVDLDRTWAALAVALDLPNGPAATSNGSRAEARSPETSSAEALPAITRRRQAPQWLRRPVWVAAAAAIAVLLVVGGIALILRLLGPDGPPVITTPTSPTSLPVTPPESNGVAIPAEVVSRGTAIIASIDTGGDTGTNATIAIGTDGLPVIAYTDISDGVINVAKCTTNDCTGDNLVTSLGAAELGTAPALALTPAGLPVVAYAVDTDGDMEGDGIMLTRCTNVECALFESAALPIETVGYGVASITVVIGSDDRPVVSFVDGDLKVVACQDPACSLAIVTTVDEFRFISWGPGAKTSAAVSSDGHPAIAYDTGSSLKLATCQDGLCATSPIITTLVDDFGEGSVSLAFSPAGLPVVAYAADLAEGAGSPTIGVISCADAACSERSMSEIQVDAAWDLSIAVTPSGFPVLTFSFRDIGIVTCSDTLCEQPVTISRLDTETRFSGGSIAIGPDGMPRIAYGAGSNLKVATCTASPCLAEDPPLPPPDERGVVTTTVSAADAELIGSNPSLVIDGNGRPAVMYTTGQENPQPKLIRCLDAACSTFTENVVDVPGFNNTLTIGPDGLPVIVHHDWERVLFTRCEDASCATTSTVELEKDDFAYFEPLAVAWDQAGAPIVAFQNGNDYYIHVVACEDASCRDFSDGRVESFADPDNTRWYTGSVDIVVPSDGLPVVAAGQTSGQVRVAKCADRACQESTATIIEDGGLDTLTSEMILGSDDLPLIAYYADGELRAAKCHNSTCTDFTVTTIGTGIADRIASVSPSLTLDRDGLPVIGFWAPGRILQLAACHDHACSRSTVSTFGEANTFALAIGSDGLPVIAYHDAPELVVAKCSDTTCGSD